VQVNTPEAHDAVDIEGVVHIEAVAARSIGHGFQDTEEDTTLNFGISDQIAVPTVGSSCSCYREFICVMVDWPN